MAGRLQEAHSTLTGLRVEAPAPGSHALHPGWAQHPCPEVALGDRTVPWRACWPRTAAVAVGAVAGRGSGSVRVALEEGAGA